MKALLGQTYNEILQIINSLNAPAFTAKQICDWIYNKGVYSIEDMTNLSLKIRENLSLSYTIGITPYIKEVISKDGTRKYLFCYDDSIFVEAVLIFDRQRTTLCISTQAGCKMNCEFCATGKQGFARNLTSNEIINIYKVLNNRCLESDIKQQISNIVFMGMGEPLDNWQEVQKTLDILTSSWGYGLSPRRITVSSCGYLPTIKEFLDSSQVDLAISLHNAINKERIEIMPIEKAYPIKEVVNLLRQYDWKGQRQLTFEYIVFKNLNDTNSHINALAKLLNGLACKINLIPFNTIPNTRFVATHREELEIFANKLRIKGFNVRIRQSKGEDISAACGLLSTKEQKL